ncbi:MAG: hypothetical protein AAFZ07_19725 [Actinomycetota bacterium]
MSGYDRLPGREPEIELDRFPYLLQVELDLIGAAARTVAVHRRDPRRRVAAALVAAAVTVLALLGGLFGGAGLRPASALRITEVDDDLVIDVIDADARPEQVEAELRAAGIAANVVRSPAPPSLDGRLVAVGLADGGEVETVDADDDLVVDRIVVPRGFGGTLELFIGDEDAEPDSAAGTAGPPEDCELLIDRPVEVVADQLPLVSTSIVWSRWLVDGDDHEYQRLGGRDEVPDDDVVVELLIDARGELHVTTTPTPEAINFPFPEARCR